MQNIYNPHDNSILLHLKNVSKMIHNPYKICHLLFLSYLVLYIIYHSNIYHYHSTFLSTLLFPMDFLILLFFLLFYLMNLLTMYIFKHFSKYDHVLEYKYFYNHFLSIAIHILTICYMRVNLLSLFLI